MKSAEIIGGFLLFYCVFHLTKYYLFCGFCSAPFSTVWKEPLSRFFFILTLFFEELFLCEGLDSGLTEDLSCLIYTAYAEDHICLIVLLMGYEGIRILN